MSTSPTTQEKSAAFDFLTALQAQINTQLPPVGELRQKIEAIRKEAVHDEAKKHLKYPEWVFINHFVTPIVSAALQTQGGLTKADARRALLCEFWDNDSMREYCDSTASRTSPTPFIKKYLEAKGAEIIEAWRADKLERACPDFAFGDPFPFKVVFEGKYFDHGNADTTLVTVIREAFLYRSFPYAPPARKKPSWNYAFSCAIACDASDTGSLVASWQSIPERVRSAFWDGADLFVMLIRPR